MNEPLSRFFDQIKKAVVCTPNQNFDNDAYKAGVLEPYGRIEKLADECKGQPSEEQIREGFELLKKIFDTKRVSDDEQRERFQEICEATGTKQLCRFGT